MGITTHVIGCVRKLCAVVHRFSKKFPGFSATLLGFLASLLFTVPAFAVTSPVGATSGSFRVSETGAATYSIPISTPPGTAGMKPSLSLNYSSQGGNGLLGMGWSLGGLSVIHRCPKTRVQDGVLGSVNFDANDRFCLDGQRLVAITGAYGAPNTEYRTESESYSRIISYGTAGNGPAYWKVWSKSGQSMEFGNTPDSMVEAQGKSSALYWGLNKVSDTAGNYLTVTYTKDAPNTQFYPRRIDYTGNAATGLATNNSVQFTYENRPETAQYSYIGGSLIKNTVRLTNVKSYAGATLVREYRLGYDNTGTPIGTSLLSALTECAGDGVCLAPTTFGWQRSTGNLQMRAAAWSFPATAVSSGWDASNLALADINGDGLADYVYFSNGLVYAMLSNGKGFNPPAQWGSGGATVMMIRNTGANLLGDINGDGKADFVYIQDGVAYVEISNGNSFSPAVAWATGITLDPAAIISAWLADVDGDGKADLIYENGGSTYVMLSTGSGFAPAVIWSSGNASAYSTYYGVGGMLSVGAVADVDGDGKADYVYASGSTVYVRLSTGTSFGAPQQWFAGLPGFDPLLPFSALADVDGDGRADLIVGYSGTTTAVAFSNGNGFTAPTSLGVSYGAFVLSANRIGDIDGDGRADFIYDQSFGSSSQINLTSAPTPDGLTTITNGLGAVTSVTYKALTDNTVYAKEAGVSYPLRDLQQQGPMYVVSRITNSDGIGGNYAMDYTYAGAKVHLQGGGFLGFRQVISHDPQAGIKTTATFRQDYPYQGMPLTSVKQTDTGVVLNQATNTYKDTLLNAAAGPVYHQSLLTLSIDTSYELNGSLLTTVTTNTQYDAYGNPTQIVVSTGDGYSKTTNNTYTNDTTNWLLGRLTLATVTSATPSAGSFTRTSSFAYNAVNGLLTQEVIEPTTPALRLQTDYTYDAYGNKLSVTVSGADITTRTTTTTYGANGQFPVVASNALNQSETRAFDARFGTPISLTGPNGLTTTWSYDSFGRKVNETRADATQTNVVYNVCDATCPYNAKYYIATTSSGSPASYVYYDMLNRAMRSQAQGFDGRLVTKDTQYDSLGRVSQTSLPYYVGDMVYWASFTYDQLNRPIKETQPDGSTNQTSYNGLTIVSTNALNQTQTKVKNSQGQLVSVTDTQNNVLTYQYDPFGNLTKTTDAKGNVTTLTYDLRGRKIAMSDPDMGYWTYQYDVLGELVKQTDAKSQVVTMSYDIIGRMLNRTEPDLISTGKGNATL